MPEEPSVSVVPGAPLNVMSRISPLCSLIPFHDRFASAWFICPAPAEIFDHVATSFVPGAVPRLQAVPALRFVYIAEFVFTISAACTVRYKLEDISVVMTLFFISNSLTLVRFIVYPPV